MVSGKKRVREEFYSVSVSGRAGSLSSPTAHGGGPQRRGALHRPREPGMAGVLQTLPLACSHLATIEGGGLHVGLAGA